MSWITAVEHYEKQPIFINTDKVVYIERYYDGCYRIYFEGEDHSVVIDASFDAVQAALDGEMDALIKSKAESETFGLDVRKIKQRMQELGLTQAELAKRAKTTEATISRWLSGKSMPTLKNAQTLAEALSIKGDVIIWHG